MKINNDTRAFLALLRAGLWESEVQLSQFEKNNYQEIFRLAEEQSVVGLVAAGIDHIIDMNIPHEIKMQFVGSSLQLEKQNMSMNIFVADLIEKLRKEDVYAILVKGQGIAQCYERPLWRAPGDVDLLLSNENYKKAKMFLMPIADTVEKEYCSFKHIGLVMNGDYVVELHGTLHSRLSRRVDRGLDEVQKDVFYNGNVRSWTNEKTTVFLPSYDNDVIFVFTHILHHFYVEGIGLRQICDWCRLIWTYRDSYNVELLHKRLCKMGLMSEWRAFAALAVEWLGMPVEAIPLYSPKRKWSCKAKRIIGHVLKMGNFGHNRKKDHSNNYLSGKVKSTGRKIKDFGHHISVFPFESIRFFCYFLVDGIKAAHRGE